jgi:hypothetical protein
MSGTFLNIFYSTFNLYHFYNLRNQFILYICHGQGKHHLLLPIQVNPNTGICLYPTLLNLLTPNFFENYLLIKQNK